MKLLKYSVSILMLSTAAIAQQPNQSPQPKEYVLRLTPDDVNVIGKALGRLPFDDVAMVIQSLRAQIIDQNTPKQPSTSKEPDK
jgi:hypothetical protein